jgi:hypothetical protein
MRVASLVLAILTGAGAVIGLFNQRYAAALAAFGFSLVFGLLYWLSIRSHRKVIGLETWLMENSDKLEAGEVLYKGQPLSWQTPLHQYLFVASLVVMTFRIPSRLYVSGIESTTRIASIYTLSSILFGPWGIPWGPIYTVQALYRNLRGGYRTTIGEWITAKRNNVV